MNSAILPPRMRERAATTEEAEQILRSALVGRIAVSRNNQPYIVPMNFVYDHGHIVIHGAETGVLIECVRGNPLVCFEVDEYIGTLPDAVTCEHDTAYRSVIAFGKAKILTDLGEKTTSLKLLVAKYANDERAQQLNAKTVDEYRSSLGNRTAVIDIMIEGLTGKVRSPENSTNQ